MGCNLCVRLFVKVCVVMVLGRVTVEKEVPLRGYESCLPTNTPLLPLAIVILAEDEVLWNDAAVLHQLLHTLLQALLEALVLPVTEPDFDTMVDLLLVGIRLVDDTRAGDVVGVVERLADETQDDHLPEGGQLFMVLFYPSNKDRKPTQEHDAHVPSVHVLLVLVLGLDSVFEYALALDLRCNVPHNVILPCTSWAVSQDFWHRS